MHFATADLCDAFGNAARAAAPLFKDFGGAARFWGSIATVQVTEDNALVREALETASRVPVEFAGVTLAPGHWLYADADGIIVAVQNLLDLRPASPP